ncbi:MAG: DsrE family protein [Halodesulfurarchaeum sp.]
MELGIILETDDPEKIWNGFRLANQALEGGHEVRTFLLGDGVEAPDVATEAYNVSGVLRKYRQNGGDLHACGTCMESRDIEPGDDRPRSTMGDLLEIVESTEKTITIG